MPLLKAGLVSAIMGSALVAPPDARWEQIWDEPGKAIIYVDRSSVRGSDDLRSIATRTTYPGVKPEGYIAERVRIEEFDCRRHVTRIREVTILADDGRPPETIAWGADESAWNSVERKRVLRAALFLM